MENFLQVIDTPLISFGETKLTALLLLKIIVITTCIYLFSRVLRAVIFERVFAKFQPDEGIRFAIARIVQYLFIFIGLLILFQSVGLDLSTLTVLSGTIGIGLGFGMQNIIENFVSGIIILLERPIKVGDRIEMGSVSGDVIQISVRSTTIRTNSNITMIVPNSEFITSRVINWSHTDRLVRFEFPVGVSYKSDPNKVKSVLLSVADEHKGVLKQPKPEVLFHGFGESSLDFELRVWTKTYTRFPLILKSELYYKIFDAFKENSIEIPYPQRDLHIKESAIPSKENS